jgi:acyl carrier protein
MGVDGVEDSLARVMAIVCEMGSLASIGADEDFYDAGFTSLSSLTLLMQLETEWDVSIPDDEFIVARSARSLTGLLTRLTEGAACA